MPELTDTYARMCREYESLYLSAAIKFPSEAVAVANKLKITDRSFAYGEHRMIFQWVCDAVQPFTHESFREMNRKHGHPLRDDNVDGFWWLEIVPTGLESWGRRIKDLEATRSRIDRFQQAITRMLERCAA